MITSTDPRSTRSSPRGQKVIPIVISFIYCCELTEFYIYLVRACLMSPDPYMPSRGEKTIHRYFLGNGKEGRDNIAKLNRYLEAIQDWRKDPNPGIVSTYPRRYNTFG